MERVEMHEGPPRLRRAFGAEREGFEPSIEVDPLCRFSKPVPSASRPSLQRGTLSAAKAECNQGEPSAEPYKMPEDRGTGGPSVHRSIGPSVHRSIGPSVLNTGRVG